MSGEHQKSDIQKLIVWASGMVEFIGGRKEPDGAILVCTARGEAAIEALFVETAACIWFHDFGGRVAARIPEIDPDRPNVGEDIDPAVQALIEWGDLIREGIERNFEPECAVGIEWVRA